MGAMPGMDMESVMLMLSQRLMLSTILMEDMVLDTVSILLVMDMDILDTLLLAMGMDTVLAMPFMEPMLDMVTDLDIVHTPLDTVLDMVMDMDMDTDMDTMVELYIVKSAEPLMTN